MAEAVTHRHATSIVEDISAQHGADPDIDPGVIRQELIAGFPF
jgi:hypothetical protein